MIAFFKILGWFEGISLLTLFLFAMPMKYFAHEPIFVKFVGSIHGGLFLAYVGLATLIAQKFIWKRNKLFMAYLCSMLPFGTFYFEKKHLFAHD